MKNLVNNKSFDEIFAQRGEQVQPENLVVGQYYLLEHTLCAPTASITLFESTGGVEDVPKGQSSAKIGRMVFHNTQRHFIGGATTFSGAYEATQDQIDLLNSYR